MWKNWQRNAMKAMSGILEDNWWAALAAFSILRKILKTLLADKSNTQNLLNFLVFWRKSFFLFSLLRKLVFFLFDKMEIICSLYNM